MILESHIAKVMSNTDDKDKLFAVKVQIDEINPGEYPELARPLFPCNFIKAPKPGQQIEVLVRADDYEEEPGEGDLGVEDFPDFCYYTGRIFDLKDGKVHDDLKTNYPKRSGWWLEDGTIIYLDETNGSKEIALVLSGGDNYLRIKEQELTAQLGSDIQVTLTPSKAEMKFQNQVATLDASKAQLSFGGGAQAVKLDSGGCTITDTITKIGGSAAANPLLKGTETIAAFTALFTAWANALGILAGSSGSPADVLVYANSMVAGVGAIQATLATWPSLAHFQDGR